MDIIGNQAYKLNLPPMYSRLHPTFHVSVLELYHPRPGEVLGQWDNLPELVEGEEEWEIEAIVSHRTRRNGTQYKVRWKGWPKEYDEWIHEGYLGNAKRMVDQYRSQAKPITNAKRSRKRRRS